MLGRSKERSNNAGDWVEWAEDSIGEQVTQGGKQTHLGAVDVKEKKNKMKAIGQHDLAAFSWTPMIGPQIN